MKTLQNTKTHKSKSIEVAFSNMTFIIHATCHYMASLNTPGWSSNMYEAYIKETGEGIGFGKRPLIRKQMEIINSRPDLFLK